MSKVPQKKKDGKPKRKVNNWAPLPINGGVKLLQLEHNVPIIAKSGREESEKLRAALTEIFRVAKPGDSTVIAGKSFATAIRHLRHRFPEYTYRNTATDKTKKFIRIWRVK